jgi:hypothetical protein
MVGRQGDELVALTPERPRWPEFGPPSLNWPLTPTPTPPRKPKRRERTAAQRRLIFLYLCAGVGLTAAGIFAFAHTSLLSPMPAKPVTPPGPRADREGRQTQASARSSESKFPSPRSVAGQPPSPQVDHIAQREKLLADLEANGGQPAFIPIWHVPAPAPSAPQTFYCLLHEPLDEATEDLWKEAGMLRHETHRISPYLRMVTIDSPEALRKVGALADKAAYRLDRGPGAR